MKQIDWIAIFQFVIAGGMLAGVIGVFKIADQLRLMNGRIGRLEDWRVEHTKWADREQANLAGDIDRIRDRIEEHKD